MYHYFLRTRSGNEAHRFLGTASQPTISIAPCKPARLEPSHLSVNMRAGAARRVAGRGDSRGGSRRFNPSELQEQTDDVVSEYSPDQLQDKFLQSHFIEASFQGT